jgi:quinol-cytochrome oxidoreductase complex cytochrome b subunit
VGVVLYATILSLYVTGESLHWDEVGFAVPWHMSEFFQAIHLNNALQYNFSDLLAPASATTKLTQIFALHISVLPLLLLILIPLHLFLIRMKGISAPFWKIASGQQVSFSRHIKVWLIAGGIATIAVFLIAIVIGRDAGTAPQLLSSSPLYEAHKGPGALGFKPSWPIGWTHGMNVFVAKMGLEPDIWGTVITLLLFFTLLLLVPFIDRMDKEPATITEAFDWRRRYGAFILIALFLIVMFTGMIINALAGPG